MKHEQTCNCNSPDCKRTLRIENCEGGSLVCITDDNDRASATEFMEPDEFAQWLDDAAPADELTVLGGGNEYTICVDINAIRRWAGLL